MSLKLTPAILAGVYESLRLCPPFVRWKLPPCEDIGFQVTRHRDREGHYTRYVGTDHHFICVSQAHIVRYDALSAVMAHEMIHLAQAIHKTEPKHTGHNADFKKRAQRVCKVLGFDGLTFCG